MSTPSSVPLLLPPRGSMARRVAVAVLVLAPFLYGLLAICLGQDANWDLRNYHWYNAYAFLNGRDAIDLLPSQTPYFYNPTIDVPFFWLGTHAPAIVAGFALAFVQGFNFVFLFLLIHYSLIFSNPLRKVWAAAAMAAMGVLGAGAISQIGTVFYDNVTSIGIFASALLVVVNTTRFKEGAWLWAFGFALLAGLPAGLMMGLKLPSVVFCVGLCGSLLFLPLPLFRRLWIPFAFGCGIVIGVAISFGHWGWFLQSHYGSPMFPYFNQIFQSPLAPLTSARDVQFIPQSTSEWFLYPYIFSHYPTRVSEIPWRDWRIVVLYTLLPVSLVLHFIYRRKKTEMPLVQPDALRFLLCFAALSYVIWLLLFAIYRYAVPLEMIAPFLIFGAFSLLPLRRKTRVLWAFVLLAVIMAGMQPGNWGRKDRWLPRSVEIDRPELSDDPSLMILMAGYEPYSHVISEFPPHISFVRIESNFTAPEQDKGMNQRISEKVRLHKAQGGRFMMLIPQYQHMVAEKALRHFALTMRPQTCQIVNDHLFARLDLCEVVAYDKNSVDFIETRRKKAR